MPPRLLTTLRHHEKTLRAIPVAQPASRAAASVRNKLAEGRARAKDFFETTSNCDSADLASAFAHRALGALASRVAPELAIAAHSSRAPARLSVESARLARELGELAACLPILEGLHYLTSLYPMLLSQQQRSALGAFYTPPAMTPRRRDAIFTMTDAAGFSRRQVALVTAYLERDSAAFKKTIAQLAWDTFAWFVAEPEQIMVLRSGDTSPALLSDLVGR